MFPRGSAVQLVDPNLLPAQVIGVPRVVLDVKPEISRALLGLLLRRWEEAETGEKKAQKRGKDRWLKIRTAQVLIVTYAVALFIGAISERRCFGGLKNHNLVLVVFNVFLLVFNEHIYTHCIYKLISLLQDVLITSLFRQGGKQAWNKCKATAVSFCLQRNTMCCRRLEDLCSISSSH